MRDLKHAPSVLELLPAERFQKTHAHATFSTIVASSLFNELNRPLRRSATTEEVPGEDEGRV